MPTAKIDIKYHNCSFQAEGEQEWLSALLEKFFSKMEKIPTDRSEGADASDEIKKERSKISSNPGTLASFLTTQAVSGNQTRRFLATAVWLRAKGATKHTTAQISKALSDNHQSKLSNPAQCLIENVKKGHCEREGKEFYITPEGLKSFGIIE